ncbi:resistance protein [Musa troglodytarum]|uniref:Resistance protein n=1 Tax=Musa troglodytarum TaxID=320322 RepID=A0A9E7HT49_9LILI|nr:resistance protein [Musa troglodytarum]
MSLAFDLERVLLRILPMPAMMAQGRLLGMPNHMEMIRDRLWAINGTILDAELRASKEPELEEWVTDVGAAIVDVEDLLGRILDWHPGGGAATASNRSSRSICSIRVASRQAILLELKETVGRLNYLVRRGSVLGLSKEKLESVDPRQEEEEYSTVLREEVVGRNEDVEEIIDILRQQQSGDGVEWLLIDGDEGKTTLARLIYHHPWVQEQFQHRIWVDVPNSASLDPMWIMREFTRSITGEPCEDIWQFYDGVHGSKYLLVLDDLSIGKEEEEDKWLQLENFLLLVGAPGSTVVVVPDPLEPFIERILGSSVRNYELGDLSEEDWVKLWKRQALIRPDQQEEANAIIQSYLRNPSCDRSPKAAMALGSVFRYTEMNRWQQEIVGFLKHQVEGVLPGQEAFLIMLRYGPRKWTRVVLNVPSRSTSPSTREHSSSPSRSRRSTSPLPQAEKISPKGEKRSTSPLGASNPLARTRSAANRPTIPKSSKQSHLESQNSLPKSLRAERKETPNKKRGFLKSLLKRNRSWMDESLYSCLDEY